MFLSPTKICFGQLTLLELAHSSLLDGLHWRSHHCLLDQEAVRVHLKALQGRLISALKCCLVLVLAGNFHNRHRALLRLGASLASR